MRISVVRLIVVLSVVVFLAGVVATVPGSARAAGYPEKAVTVVVPLNPGGNMDLNARALTGVMEKELKQPVVVVNKPGGAMTIGGYAVASAKPDGYTLGFFSVGASIPEVFSYFYQAPYSSNDLKPVCRVGTPVLTISVRSDAPYNSLKELVEYARKNPRMKFGDVGKSGTGYSVMATIAKTEKLELVEVPLEGDGPTVTGILSGQIPIGLPAYSAVKALVDAGKIKVLALCVDKRAPFAPNVPAVVELGYKPPYIPYLGLFAPKGTPDAVVKRLEEVVQKASGDKDFQNKVREVDNLLSFENTASFDATLQRYKKQIHAFFKEEGMVK